jgi:hypothetical protein
VGAPPVRYPAGLLDQPRRGLGLALLLCAGLRMPFLAYPLTSDEGGYLYVARHWPGPGHSLYGGQWVDRPPVLFLVFKLAVWLGSSTVAVRSVALVLAWLLVLAAWRTGALLAGPRGAVVALVAAGLGSNPLILGDGLISDGMAATFVMCSLWLLAEALVARDTGRSGVYLATASGVLSSAALLTKQNALLAAVMAAVLIGARPRRRWPVGVAFATGSALPLAATLLWAATGPGIGTLVDALFTFRLQAAHVVWHSASHAPSRRESGLLAVAFASGVGVLLVQLALTLLGRRGPLEVRAALVAGTGCLVASVVLSLNGYAYYLLAVTPLAAVAAATATRPARPARLRLPSLPRTVALATCACAVAAALVQHPGRPDEAAVVGALRRAGHPHDTLVVAYGQPNVLEAAGMTTPYPYSWSLPVRVEDPHLRVLAALLAGPRAPTWVAEIGHLDDWHLETPRVAHLIATRYRVVDVACGHRLYLRRPLQRAGVGSAPARCQGG